jgi:hypothetical protein
MGESAQDIPAKSERALSQERNYVDTIRFIHEFQQKTYWEGVGMLTRVMAFYLAVTSFLFGYILTKGLSPRLSVLFVGVAVAVSTIFLVVLVAWAWGLTRIVDLLDSLTLGLDRQAYEDLRMKAQFRTWRRINRVVIVGTVLVVVVIIAGLLLWGRWATQGQAAP